MTHRLLTQVLDAQRVNATLSGSTLRAAAASLVAGLPCEQVLLRALDLAGERIIGAALALSDSLEPYDFTRPFPEGATCLLVGGVVAGPASIAAAVEAVTAAGACRIEVALLAPCSESISSTLKVRYLGDAGYPAPWPVRAA